MPGKKPCQEPLSRVSSLLLTSTSTSRANRDQEESTDGERQRRTISLAFLSVLKRIALETKVSSWAYGWKVRTVDALGICYDPGRMAFLVDVEEVRLQALNPLTDTCENMEEDGW